MRRLSTREKRFILVGGILASLIISYHVSMWYSGMITYTREQLETKRTHLQRFLNKLSQRDEIQRRLSEIENELRGLEKGLLLGDKPPVAAAELQKVLKDMALSSGVEIKSERALGAAEAGMYLRIPVEIAFITSTKGLVDMLHRIRSSPLLLTVSRLRVRVTDVRNPEKVFTTLIVSGFIRKQEVGQNVP